MSNKSYPPSSHGISPEVWRTFCAISDPANRDIFTKEAAYKAFQHVRSTTLAKPEKILDDWPESAEETLLVVERYYYLSRKFAHQYDFSLQLFMYPVSAAEIEAVVHAEDKLAAAGALMTNKINRW